MRLLLVLILAVIITSGVLVLVRNWAATRPPRPGRWRIEERSDGELLTLHAVRPGDEPLLLGSAPTGAADFDSRVYEARAEAREKLAALNDRP